MKTLIDFITESQNALSVDETLNKLKSAKNGTKLTLIYTVLYDDNNEYWMMFENVCCFKNHTGVIGLTFIGTKDKSEKILNELSTKYSGKLSGNDWNCTIVFDNIDNLSECTKEIAKEPKKYYFINGSSLYFTTDRTKAINYMEAKNASLKTSFDDQIDLLDNQIKELQDKKDKLVKMKKFVDDIDKD